MGYMRHNAIVVTSWNAGLIEAAAEHARSIGLTVLGPCGPLVNDYRSMLVCPDGSKEGWDASDEGDRRREKLIDWLNAQRYEDGSSSLEWVEVAFGRDDRKATIERTAWTEKEGGGK